jgi:uncharacterized protein (TIGR00369 family)
VSADTPPEGFKLWEGRGGFSTHIGPYWRTDVEPGRASLAFFGEPRHANTLGLVHGGMLSSFMDTVLANAVISQADKPVVTVHLAIDYLSMARAGRWVMGEGRVTRLAKDLAFAEGRGFIGGQDVVRATGIFKIMSPRPTA